MRISSHDKGVILGMALAGQVNGNRLKLRVSPERLDYLRFKADTLYNILGRTGIRTPEIKMSPSGKYEFVAFHEAIGQVGRKLYSPQKHITKEILSLIPDEGIAFWYMDEGGLILKDKESLTFDISIGLYPAFNEEDAAGIIDFFKERYGLKFNLRGKPGKRRLACGSGQSKTFLNNIDPFICEGMRHKSIDTLIDKVGFIKKREEVIRLRAENS